MRGANAQIPRVIETPDLQVQELQDFIQEREHLAQQRQQERDYPNAISLRQTSLELLLNDADFQGSELTEKTRFKLYSSCQEYGDRLLRANDHDLAAKIFKQALKAASAGRAPDHPDVIEARDGYAKDLELLGEDYYGEAANTLKENCEIRKKLYGRADRRTAATEESRADILAEMTKPDQQTAVKIYRENLRLYQAETLVSPNDASIHDLMDSTKWSLAMVLQKLRGDSVEAIESNPERRGYLIEAQQLFEEVLQHRKGKLGGAEDKDTVFVRLYLARVLFYLGLFREARRQFRINQKNGRFLPAKQQELIQGWINGCEEKGALPSDSDSDTGSKSHAPIRKSRVPTSSEIYGTVNHSAAQSAVAIADNEDPKPGDIKRRRTFDRIAQNESQGRYSRQAQPQETGDDEYSPQLGVLHSKDAVDADGWLAGLRKSHGLLEIHADKTRKEYQHVKIAILDSGIDGSLQCFKHSTRIMAWKSWVKGDDTKDVRFRDNPAQQGELIASTCRDEIGHGTHAAALLMQVNPLAEIYIARVTVEKKDFKPDDVAAAIEHASKIWQVDIISMSFGFKTRYQCIADAVFVAKGCNVLMFAATSNDGMNSPSPLFPADFDDVVCVSATNRKGKVADGQAQPFANKNYTTLGVDVPSKWPRKFFPLDTSEDDLVKISGGSSVATAIMSASASLFFEFIRQEAVRSSEYAVRMKIAEKAMKQAQGMRIILNAHTVLTGGHRYVVPWKILDKSKPPSAAYKPREYARHLILLPLSDNGFDFRED